MEKPLEFLIAYTDPDPKQRLIVWIALDNHRVFRFHEGEAILLATDVEFRKAIDPMRDLSLEDVIRYWKTDIKIVDAWIKEKLDYAGHQDETLNRTNRGYMTQGDTDDEVQNFLLRSARILFTGNME